MFVYMFSFNHNALLRPAPAKKHPTKKNPVAEIELRWLQTPTVHFQHGFTLITLFITENDKNNITVKCPPLSPMLFVSKKKIVLYHHTACACNLWVQHLGVQCFRPPQSCLVLRLINNESNM